MRSIIVHTALGMLVAAGMPSLAQPPGQCGGQQMRGTWSVSMSGWQTFTAGPAAGQTAPVVGVAVVVVDYQGNFTGPGTIVIGGVVNDFEMSGTVEITPECTGVLKYAVKVKGSPVPAPGFIERAVFDPKNDQAVTASVQAPAAKPMWISTIRRLSNQPLPVTWPEL